MGKMATKGKDHEVVVDVREGATETAWHAFATANDVLAELKASEGGLSSSEAATRLATYGRNALTPPKKAGFFVRLWRQINNVLIFVLLIAAVVTGALQAFADMGLILGVVFINVAIGMFQEGKAEAAAEAIKAMLSSSASVLRDGERKSIDAEEVVPGDVIFIKSGDKIPADIRLISTSNLQVRAQSESAIRRATACSRTCDALQSTKVPTVSSE
jgi:magnesium-transporting ATPase (P-type)